MNDSDRVGEADLNAYLDGELDAGRRAAVEAHLAGDAGDRARLSAWRQRDEAIRALYGKVADASPPPRLSVRRIAAERRRPGRGAMAAAAAVLLVVGGVGGWIGRGTVAPGTAELTLVSEAEVAHALYTPEVAHPVEVSAADGRHLSAWLSRRLDRSIVIPDLTGDGFALVGGRLLPAGSGPAAQFMYEDRSGRRVTLYLVPGGGAESSLRFQSGNGLTAVYWLGGALACVMVGDLPRDRLMPLARASYEALDAPSGA